MRDLRLLLLLLAAYLLMVPTCIGVAVWREGLSTDVVVGGFSLSTALSAITLAILQVMVMFNKRARSEAAAYGAGIGVGDEKA